MIWLRSLVYNVFLFTWLTLVLIVLVPFGFMPRRYMRAIILYWARTNQAALTAITGLDCEVRGRENLPDGPVVLACMHQSFWETAFLLTLFENAAFVLKKELLSIPLWGWYSRRWGNVSVERDGAASALRKMLREARDRIAAGRPIVIFPEGTRVAPGERRPLHVGVAALYVGLAVPVVPVALNSGVFWGRRAFLKYPGVITLEFLPPIPAGLDKRVFLAELQSRFEGASMRIRQEAETSAPAGPRLRAAAEDRDSA